MQHQTATVKRKKKSTLWGLAAILFCVNIVAFYLLFTRPAALLTEKRRHAPEAPQAELKHKPSIVTRND